MTSHATPKVLGTAPESFDSSATKAENFLSALQNYYYLNDTIYTDESRRVAAALTHFKVSTPAGEWAQTKQETALKLPRITYSSWTNFIKAFRQHFIPVQTEQEAMNAIWTIKMNNCPFHEWYQEWSTYTSRSGANDATKMYAFRQALPAGLNNKLIGVSPALTTLDDLVDKTRLFDQQWQLWHNTHSPSTNRRSPGARVCGATTNDPSINLADTNNPSPKRGKLSKEEHEHHFKAGHCLYCDKKGHYAKECCARPQQSGHPQFTPLART
jgi:hypothetical protein